MRLYSVVSLLCTVFSKLCYLIPPFALKLVVDTLTENQKLPVDQRITPLPAIALSFAAARIGALLTQLSSVTYSAVSSANSQRFSVNVFRHLQHLDLEYHVKRKTGEVQSVMNRGTNSVNTLMHLVVFSLGPT